MKKSNFVNRENMDCRDIYAEETQNSIKTLKRFREAWLRSPSGWNSELFQYADSEFYFYRFAVDRQERGKEALLISILYRVMKRYGLYFDVPDDRRNAPFEFIVCSAHQRIGYRLSDFCEDEDVNEILDNYKVDEACVIRMWKSGRADEWISRENEQYERTGIRLKSISVKEFFDTYFSTEEYDVFTKYIEQYLKETREITGYTSVKFLSSMNLATRKMYEEKMLSDWDYKNYQYQIINPDNKKIQNYLYLASTAVPDDELRYMDENYIHRKLFRSMLGRNEYAESFITSEWLYHSLREKKNFDYTAVISGYLKSIEQLLYHIVMINVDNGCKISMSGATKVRDDAVSAGVDAFIHKKDGWKKVSIGSRGYYYIDLTQDQVKYMDSSIGTFEYFLRYNPKIFNNPQLANMISDMVCCFRTECRNGYFHIHNLKNWDTVEKTRSNALYLYFILIGECIIPEEKECELGMIKTDDFDELCKKIREFRHYNSEYIFEYSDGRTQKLIYDFINNTVEYTDDGVEHYQNLLFYEVDEFSLEAYEKLDEGIREEQKVYITRETLPSKIIGVYRDHRKEYLYISE